MSDKKLNTPNVSRISQKSKETALILTQLGMEDAKKDVSLGTASVKVTKHHDRGKLGGMPGLVSVNTSPIINKSCDNCEVNNECYARRMMFTFRSNLCRRFGYNKYLFSEHVTMDSFMKFSPKFGEKVTRIRIHSFGEIEDKQHAEKILFMVNSNGDKKFTIYTRVGFFGMQIPPNLDVIYSNSRPDDFSVVREMADDERARFYLLYTDKSKIPKDILDRAHECIGKCNSCKNCYSEGGKKVVISVVR